MSHNPLSIDTESTPPDFVNEQGSKWWQIDIGLAKDGTAWRVKSTDGQETYLILRDNEPIYMTTGLEDLAYKFTQLELMRKYRVNYKPRNKRKVK